MNCKWCDKKLTDTQIYQFLIGKSKGSACSRKCSLLIYSHGSKESYIQKLKSTCIVCGSDFQRQLFSGGKVCSTSCQGKLSSDRMKKLNPMFIEEFRNKASRRQKEINHKPKIQGGNGRGATVQQLLLYNELSKIDTSFSMEYIEKTGHLAKQLKSPRHYKIDIASKYHMIAIEVDGSSHSSLKIKECDERKNKLLTLKGWKVLRFTNSQIQKELENCVQMVMSMT
jgi:predicted nucleic acid-binding Zn ribbon protein